MAGKTQIVPDLNLSFFLRVQINVQLLSHCT